jgi:hypothetical protein
MFGNANSHCLSVHILCPITLKQIPLDFSGHVLSSNAIKSVKSYPKIGSDRETDAKNANVDGP